MELQKAKLHKRLGVPLLIWAGINIIAGSFYLFSPDEFLRGALTIAFIWGLVNGIIGLIIFVGKKDYVLEKEKKVILINVYVDAGYIIVGLFLIFLGNNTVVIGSGYGVIIQGIFLFILDFSHLKHVKKLMLNEFTRF